MAGGLRYETGREMPPGMQEIYGVKLAVQMQADASNGFCEGERIATPAPPARNDNEGQERMLYCGDAPMSEDLPSCPFCGSDNLLVDRDSEGWYLECNGCLAEGPRAKTQAEAERRWSGRC